MKLSLIGSGPGTFGPTYLLESRETRFLVHRRPRPGTCPGPAACAVSASCQLPDVDFCLSPCGAGGGIMALSGRFPSLAEEAARTATVQVGNQDPHPFRLADRFECGHAFFPGPAVRCRLRRARHISSTPVIEIWLTEYGLNTKLLFTTGLRHPDFADLATGPDLELADILIIELPASSISDPGGDAFESAILAWSDHFRKPPRQVFVTSGDSFADASLALPESDAPVRGMPHRAESGLGRDALTAGLRVGRAPKLELRPTAGCGQRSHCTRIFADVLRNRLGWPVSGLRSGHKHDWVNFLSNPMYQERA